MKRNGDDLKKSMQLVRQREIRWRSDTSDIELIREARNRLLTLITQQVRGATRFRAADRRFALLRGMEPKKRDDLLIELEDDWYVLDDLRTSFAPNKLGRSLCTWFQALQETGQHDDVASLSADVRALLSASPCLGLRLHRGKHRITVFPNGAGFLDAGTVDDVLEWLDEYPESARHFASALATFSTGDSSRFRNLLDELRCSLEQLLRGVLKNKKSLENQDPHLLQWAADRGLHKQAVNMLKQLLGQYCQYQNQAVKHNEEWGIHEVEFMIYLTGTFMRLLLQLAGSESERKSG